jgi:hypothetical protein
LSGYTGIVLDESSILKSYTGKYRTFLIENTRDIPFKLACTATPAPNDHMELGNHSEFLGVMSRTEMLAQYFVHDGGETQKWRLKGHAVSKFWEWVASWAVMIRKPSDLGYEDSDFILPPINFHEVVVQSENPSEGHLFAMEAQTLIERRDARRASIEDRVNAIAEIINSDEDQWLVWCDLNNESQLLSKAINNATEVTGSQPHEYKKEKLLGFSDGSVHRLVSKPLIAGMGMNFQRCHKVAFVGLSDSYEQFYQAVRRVWRFGQKHPVECYIVTADTEGAVVDNIKRKEKDAAVMANEMVKFMHLINEQNIRGTGRITDSYNADMDMIIPEWLKTEAKIEVY